MNKCRKRLLVSCGTRIQDRLKDETRCVFPKTLSPSVGGLEDGFAAMVFPKLPLHRWIILISGFSGKCQRAQTPFSHYQGPPGQVTGPLHDLRLECQEKDKELLVYTDVQQPRINQSLVGYVCSWHVSLAAKRTGIRCVLEMP